MDKAKQTTSNIAYKGNVKIEFIDRDGQRQTLKRRNEGKDPLFSVIVKALSGDSSFALVDDRPSNLMAYNEAEEPLLIQAVYQNSKPVIFFENAEEVIEINSDTTFNTIQYVFLIPPSNIADKSSEIKMLKLLNNKKEVCAEIEVNPTISTNTASNILIYWNLKFDNKE